MHSALRKQQKVRQNNTDKLSNFIKVGITPRYTLSLLFEPARTFHGYFGHIPVLVVTVGILYRINKNLIITNIVTKRIHRK